MWTKRGVDLARTIVLAVSCFSCQSGFAAGNLAGSAQPEFKAAVERWLAYDDKVSINELAELARNGNIAARIFLARVERSDRAPSPYIEALSRIQRLELFRGPRNGGAFFPSWLEIESVNGNELAQALKKIGSPFIDLDTIKQLIHLGEVQATDHLVRIAALYGDSRIHKELLRNGVAMDELHPYVLSFKEPPEKLADGVEALRYIASDSDKQALDIDISNPDTWEAAQFLALGIPFGSVSEDNRWRPAVEHWLFNHDAMQPIADVCNLKCPMDAANCAVTIVGLTGGYFEAIRLDSPLEAVIPQSVFLASNRARQQALRRAALTRAEDGREIATLEEVATRSECLAKEIAIQRESGMYKN